MKRFLLAVAAAVALWASPPQAQASACSVNQYMHNGSLMETQVCESGVMSISYIRPRPGMAKQGARNGSLLFDGFEGPGGVITGQSRLFSARCGVVPYAVSGSMQGNTIVLNGTAPIRGNECQVVRYRQDNLVFTLVNVGAAPGGPQVVQPTCPPGFFFDGSQCIRQNAGPAPIPQPAPPPRPGVNAGDWYAIAISTKSRGEAQRRANALGPGWFVMNTAQCPNFRNGYWIATAGGFAKDTAQLYVNQAGGDSYKKTCH